MNDHSEADYSPFAPQAAQHPALPRSIETWRLQKAGTVVNCEIRNDRAKGVGWDALLLEKGELGFSKMSPTHERAQFVAETWRQDYIRAGYDPIKEDGTQQLNGRG
jgi:hypothetical protein